MNRTHCAELLPLLAAALVVAFNSLAVAAPATQAAGPMQFSGTVRDRLTHQPIAGATVILHREIARQPEKWDKLGEPENLATDGNGKFEFTVTAEQAAEKHFCLATEVGHPKYAARMWEGEGLSRILDEQKRGERPWFENIEMSPAEPVTGIIHDPNGNALADCPINFVSIAGDEQTAGLKLGADISMGETKTDASGRFTFLAIKGAELVGFQAAPTDYAMLSQRVGAKRGEIGIVQLHQGRRLSGSVADEKGEPVAGAKVECESDKRYIALYNATSRSTVSDAAGRFALDPVEDGAYRVSVADERFLPVKIEVSAQSTPAPIDFRPPPANLIRVHFRDSAGKASTRRNRVSLSANKGEIWFHSDYKGDHGEAELRVPKGMDRHDVMVLGWSDVTTLWRWGNDGSLRRGDEIRLNSISDDVDITVIEYTAPKLMVKAIGPDNQPLTKFQPQIEYTNPILRMPPNHGWRNNKGDVGFSESESCGWETQYMLAPDHEFTLTINAEGLAPASKKLTMKEGETREVTVQLKRQ